MEPKQAYEILKNRANLEDNVKQALLDVIKTDPQYAYYYVKYVIKGRWLEAEDTIKTHPQYACWYAINVIKRRFPEAEEYIKTKPQSACWYAKYVIKGRWIEAEEYIKTDPESTHEYARDVMNDSNFWKNQAALEEFMNNVPKHKPSELDALKKQREELDNKIKQLECA